MNVPLQVSSYVLEDGLIGRALAALEDSTGITAQAAGLHQPAAGRPEAALGLSFNGVTWRYHAITRLVDRAVTLEQIAGRLAQFPMAGLLVTHSMSAAMANKCREIGLQFIDTQGNAHLRAADLFVFVSGQRRVAATTPAPQRDVRAGTPAVLRLIFALLRDPALLNAPYRVLADTAKVSLGLIGGVLNDLASRGFISGSRGQRRFLEYQRLIGEWATYFPARLRPKLHARRFHAQQEDWWHNVDIASLDAQWGGEIAADRMTGYLKPGAVTIYMQPAQMQRHLTRLLVQNRLRADPHGEVEVLESFWTASAPADLAPPLVVYADLMASMDSRNAEAAALIHRQMIDAYHASS